MLNNTKKKDHFTMVLLITTVTILLTYLPLVYAESPQKNEKAEITSFSNEKVVDKTSCHLGGSIFELVLASPSGEATEDDTTVWFVQAGKAEKANPNSPNYISLLPALPKDNLICREAAAVQVQKSYIAVPFFVSGRPGLDYLSVAVYDFQKNKVETYEVLNKYFGGTPQINLTKNGFSYLAVFAQPNDGVEGLVEMWLNITWDGKQLIKKWDRSRPVVRH